MNPHLRSLYPYPFQRLNALFDGVSPPADLAQIKLSIGEPKHPTPALIHEALAANLSGLAIYPTTKGLDALRSTIANWLSARFSLPEGKLDPARHVLPVNGTREALFAFAQCVIKPSKNATVLMPNPFYQIYEGAALLAGAKPWYINPVSDDNTLPNFDTVPDSVWQDTQLLYLCSPANPSGAVTDASTLKKLIERADEFDFIIASDECYSEIYTGKDKPVSLLQACVEIGREDFSRCVVFHSLSKRSNAPGLRSGFIAGDASIIEPFLQYRTYHGSAMSVQNQMASVAAWQDEAHVEASRTAYKAKFKSALGILDNSLPLIQPEGGFYLWPRIDGSDEDFARELYAQQNVVVLPGSYLSREFEGDNPGSGRIRMALVAEQTECDEAMQRIKQFLNHC